MSDELIKISAKNLGQLALPSCCPKCFWLKLKLNNKLPWQIFPGIFSTIDSYSKKITWQYFNRFKGIPPWFAPFGEFIGLMQVPHWSKFCIVVEEFGIKLAGVPDDLFIMADGRVFIVDYKTAKFTANQDALLPMYQVQLNGYALIFERLGMGQIGGLGLCYYEPQGDAATGTIETVLMEGGFNMPFTAHLKEIELDPAGVVLPLLIEVRRYGEMEKAPEGRDGCGDCEILGRLVGLVG